MAVQSNVPAYPEDHDRFKQIAAEKKVSMKDLFHEWVKHYNWIEENLV